MAVVQRMLSKGWIVSSTCNGKALFGFRSVPYRNFAHILHSHPGPNVVLEKRLAQTTLRAGHHFVRNCGRAALAQTQAFGFIQIRRHFSTTRVGADRYKSPRRDVPSLRRGFSWASVRLWTKKKGGPRYTLKVENGTHGQPHAGGCLFDRRFQISSDGQGGTLITFKAPPTASTFAVLPIADATVLGIATHQHVEFVCKPTRQEIVPPSVILKK
jgi:hypothetical protein